MSFPEGLEPKTKPPYQVKLVKIGGTLGKCERPALADKNKLNNENWNDNHSFLQIFLINRILENPGRVQCRFARYTQHCYL